MPTQQQSNANINHGLIYGQNSVNREREKMQNTTHIYQEVNPMTLRTQNLSILINKIVGNKQNDTQIRSQPEIPHSAPNKIIRNHIKLQQKCIAQRGLNIDHTQNRNQLKTINSTHESIALFGINASKKKGASPSKKETTNKNDEIQNKNRRRPIKPPLNRNCIQFERDKVDEIDFNNILLENNINGTNINMTLALDGKASRGLKRKRKNNVELTGDINSVRKKKKALDLHSYESDSSASSADVLISDLIVDLNKNKYNKQNKNIVNNKQIIINNTNNNTVNNQRCNGNQLNKYNCNICKRRFSLSFLTENSEIPHKDCDLICKICRLKIAGKIIVRKPEVCDSEVCDSENKNFESENIEQPNQKVAAKCYKINCTNYIQTDYDTNQLIHCNVTCSTCNIDTNGISANKVKYEWICPRNECTGGPWLTLCGFIKHFKRMKDNYNCAQHQNNSDIYDKFHIKPCNENACKNYTKTVKNLIFKYKRINNDVGGFCAGCSLLNRSNNIRNGTGELQKYNCIDNINLLRTNVADKIPSQILDDYTNLLAHWYKMIVTSNDNRLIELYEKLLNLAPKIILNENNRGTGNSEENKCRNIQFMQNKIKAFRELDFDEIIKAVAYTECEMEKIKIATDKSKNKYEALSGDELESKINKMRKKRIERYAKLNDLSKAYKQTEYEPAMEITEQKRKKWKSKFIKMREYTKKIDYINGNYKYIKVNSVVAMKLINKMKKGSTGGPDQQSAFHHQQLINANNGEYNKWFLKYIERICNNKLTEFQIVNIMTSNGIPIPKKDPLDLRPLILNKILIRIANSYSVYSEIESVAAVQLKNQYGMNKKNALSIIVHSMDKFIDYATQKNDQYFEKKRINRLIEENGSNLCQSINIEPNKKNKIKNILNNEKYTFGDDEYINDEIIDMLFCNNSDLDNIKILMKDDMANFFNRILRKPSLINLNNKATNLYPIAYVNYSCPTKVIFDNKIQEMSDGLHQGNTVTNIIVIVNERDIMELVGQMAADVNYSIELLIELNYIDDTNKGDTIRKCIINHLLKKKIGIKYGNKFNNKKTEIILTHNRDKLNTATNQYFTNYKFKILENCEFEMLGIQRGKGNYNKMMNKKLNKMDNKIDIINSIDSYWYKYKLLNSCEKFENLNYFLQCNDNIPDIDEVGKYVIDENNEWIIKADQIHEKILKSAVNIPINDETKQIFAIGKGFGGLCIRSINNLIAPAYISCIHKIVKLLWNDLKIELLFKTDDKIRNNLKNAINWNNYNTTKKFNIEINDVFHGLDSLNINARTDDVSMCDKNLFENMLKMANLRIDITESKMDIDDEKEYENHGLYDIESKFKMNSISYGIESKIYHKIFENASIKSKIMMNARRSNKSMAFLNNIIGIDWLNEMFINNNDWNLLIRILFGLLIIDKSKQIKCNQCHECIKHENVIEHINKCRFGIRAHHFRHDEIAYYLYKVFETEFGNVSYETKSRKKGQNNEKPDIWIHNSIEYEKNKFSKIMLDVIITDVFCDENKLNTEKNKITHFMAGKIGEKNKYNIYRNRFESDLLNGYKFMPLAFDSFGGISTKVKNICNAAINYRASRLKQDVMIEKNNFYAKFSIFMKKNMIKSLKNHFIIQ